MIPLFTVAALPVLPLWGFDAPAAAQEPAQTAAGIAEARSPMGEGRFLGTDASVLARAQRQWSAGAPDHDGLGVRLKAGHRFTRRVTASARAAWHPPAYGTRTHNAKELRLQTKPPNLP